MTDAQAVLTSHWDLLLYLKFLPVIQKERNIINMLKQNPANLMSQKLRPVRGIRGSESRDCKDHLLGCGTVHSSGTVYTGRDTPWLTQQLCTVTSGATWTSCMHTHTHTHTRAYTEESRWNPHFNIPKCRLPQHDHRSICITAQQHSPAALVSLHFHSHKEKLSVHFKNSIISICLQKLH
jgi:hypothetical protein